MSDDGLLREIETVLAVAESDVYHLPVSDAPGCTAPLCRPAEDSKVRVPTALIAETTRSLCSLCVQEAEQR